MSNLPLDVVTAILCRLPVKSLIRFLSVSKLWNGLINDPDFINMHLQLSAETNSERTLIVQACLFSRTKDYYLVRFHEGGFGRAVKIYQPLCHPEVATAVVDCCNGLVCLYKSEREVAIWNPLVRKYRKLPFEPIDMPCAFKREMPFRYSLFSRFAFGHDPVHDDYKVVRVTEFQRNNHKAFEVKVYSLRANSWKLVEDEWPHDRCNSSTAFLNGVLHWLVVPLRGPLSILAFDLATEKFRMLSLPFQRDGFSHLTALGGCLCFCENIDQALDRVWLMKEYGLASSWTRLYTIAHKPVPLAFPCSTPLVLFRDGSNVLIQRDFDDLVCYNIKEKTICKVQIPGMPCSFLSAICEGSLVLLDGDSVVDPTQKKTNKRTRNGNPLEGPNLFVGEM